MEKRFWIALSILALLIGAALLFMRRPLSLKREASIEERLPAIAIVIDDWGYNKRNIELLDSIDMPITLAILPNLPFSGEIAGIMHDRGNREIILHMPMEPKDNKIRLEKDTLLTSMDERRVASLMNTAFKTVPYSKGLSNHMGSKATQDRALMRVVMKELKRRGLFFLDSIASSSTICREEAGSIGVRELGRDVFLDNIPDSDYISSQIDCLMKTARRKGFGVGIGHDRRVTLEVIKARQAQMERDGFRFVFASELARYVKKDEK